MRAVPMIFALPPPRSVSKCVLAFRSLSFSFGNFLLLQPSPERTIQTRTRREGRCRSARCSHRISTFPTGQQQDDDEGGGGRRGGGKGDGERTVTGRGEQWGKKGRTPPKGRKEKKRRRDADTPRWRLFVDALIAADCRRIRARTGAHGAAVFARLEGSRGREIGRRRRRGRKKKKIEDAASAFHAYATSYATRNVSEASKDGDTHKSHVVRNSENSLTLAATAGIAPRTFGIPPVQPPEKHTAIVRPTRHELADGLRLYAKEGVSLRTDGERARGARASASE